MPLVPPQNIDALPEPPSTTDQDNFDPEADAFLGALPTLRTQVNAANQATYSNALQALESATGAAQSAVTAQNAATAAIGAVVATGVTQWSAVTPYAQGALVWSPLNYATYRRIVAGTTPGDPSQDFTNWASVFGPQQMDIRHHHEPVVLTPADLGSNILHVLYDYFTPPTIGAITVTLPFKPPPGVVFNFARVGHEAPIVFFSGDKFRGGVAEPMVINVPDARGSFIYATNTWI